jgi:predicted RNase H-like nuclease
VLGVDGCRGGWVGVVLDDDAEPQAMCAPSIAALVEAAGAVEAIGIDIPIHLNDESDRPCDGAARRMLTPHTSRVFNAPVRRVLQARTYDEALRISREDCGKGISKQTWELVPKIDEVETWRHSSECPVYEVHPEVSFAAMTGHVIAERKRTPEGEQARRLALHEKGLVAPDFEHRSVRIDDLLDACAVAWSARRLALGNGEGLGSNGNGQAIWY